MSLSIGLTLGIDTQSSVVGVPANALLDDDTGDALRDEDGNILEEEPGS